MFVTCWTVAAATSNRCKIAKDSQGSGQDAFSRSGCQLCLFFLLLYHAGQMDMVRPRNNFAVICHGDLWLSNVLFRYEPATATCASSGAAESVSPAQMPAPAPNVFFGEGEVPTLSTLTDDSEPGRPIEVKFLDFQSARFASLATDLILFLFTSVKVSTRATVKLLCTPPLCTFRACLSQLFHKYNTLRVPTFGNFLRRCFCRQI